MLTQQTFDGTTLEAALARVSEEVGPSARITQAEKIRSGGLGGFFARERFEVTVEIDDHSGAEEPIAPEQPAASGTPAAVTLLDLAEQVSHQERITTLPGVREEMPDGAEVAEVWPRTPLVGNDPDLPLPSTEGTTFHEVLRGIASEAGLLHPATGTAGSAPEELVPAGGDASSASPPSPLVGEFSGLGVPSALLDQPDGGTSPAQYLLAALERLPEPPPLVAGPGDVVVVAGDEAVVLEAAGLAATLIGLSPLDVVVARHGKRGAASLRSPATAASRVEQFRRCAGPSVVALCAPGGPTGRIWTRQMLDSLVPVAVWAAVRADRKAEDIAAWVDDLGSVDALAVGACAETVSPAAVLTGGVPVVCLEGRRATPAAWTALLVERLAA